VLIAPADVCTYSALCEVNRSLRLLYKCRRVQTSMIGDSDAISCADECQRIGVCPDSDLARTWDVVWQSARRKFPTSAAHIAIGTYLPRLIGWKRSPRRRAQSELRAIERLAAR
jgi:hypothetical protein